MQILSEDSVRSRNPEEEVSALAEVRSAQNEAFWRLDGASSGSSVDAYWPDFDSWLPAKLVRVNVDGSYCVKWKSDNSISDVPTDFVRKPGEGKKSQRPRAAQNGKGESVGMSSGPPLMKLLRMARPNWSDQDIYTVSDKLKLIDIKEVSDLVEAVCAEMESQSDGVNRRLQKQNLKAFAEPTLRALLRHGEKLLAAEAESPVKDIAPRSSCETQRGEPQRSGAFSSIKPGAFSGYAKDMRKRVESMESQPATVHVQEVEETQLPDRTNGAGPVPEQPSSPWGVQERLAEETPLDIPDVEAAAMNLSQPSNTQGLPVEEAACIEREPEQAMAYCGRGHPLRYEDSPYDMDCDRCGREMCSGEKIWWCGLCGYDLCGDCHADQALG